MEAIERTSAVRAGVRLEVITVAWMAIEAGASALGFVSAMPSGPGVIPDGLIAEIARQVPPPIATVLLTIGPAAIWYYLPRSRPPETAHHFQHLRERFHSHRANWRH